MFADYALAARVERAESHLSADFGRAVIESGHEPQAFVEEVGGGIAVFAGAGSPVNKLIGAGFEGVPDADRIAAVEGLFAAREAPVQAEVATLADPAWHAEFSTRGYVLAGFENVLGRSLSDPIVDRVSPQRPSMHDAANGFPLTIVECRRQDQAAWLDAVVTGFEHPDLAPAQAAGQEFQRTVIEQLFGVLAIVPDFRCYLAYVDGTVAGGASLRTQAGVAQLCGAATLPAYRRRGVQTALLETRLRDAQRQGCDVAVITTAPGSTSQQNAQRRGFSLLYARALHVKPTRR